MLITLIMVKQKKNFKNVCYFLKIFVSHTVKNTKCRESKRQATTTYKDFMVRRTVKVTQKQCALIACLLHLFIVFNWLPRNVQFYFNSNWSPLIKRTYLNVKKNFCVTVSHNLIYKKVKIKHFDMQRNFAANFLIYRGQCLQIWKITVTSIYKDFNF